MNREASRAKVASLQILLLPVALQSVNDTEVARVALFGLKVKIHRGTQQFASQRL